VYYKQISKTVIIQNLLHNESSQNQFAINPNSMNTVRNASSHVQFDMCKPGFRSPVRPEVYDTCSQNKVSGNEL